MDQTPTAPMTPFEPPRGEPIVDVSPTAPLPPGADLVISSDQPPSGRWARISDRAASVFDTVQAESGRFGLAVLGALAIGALWFVVLGSLVFALDDRDFWSEQLHLLTQYWYVFAIVATAAVAPLFIALRDGTRAARQFVLDRGYWKVLLAGWLVMPALVAVVVFVATNLVAVLVTIAVLFAVLLVLIFTVGGV